MSKPNHCLLDEKEKDAFEKFLEEINDGEFKHMSDYTFEYIIKKYKELKGEK